MTDVVWQHCLSVADAVVIEELFARVRAVDGLGSVGITIEPGTRYLLVRSGGRPVGVGWRIGHDPAELVVDPEYRRRGIGSRLATALLDSAPVDSAPVESGPLDSAPLDGAGIWAHGNLAPAVALADSLGLLATRELLQLRRDLVGEPAVALPDGVRIRTFVPGRDEDAFLGVNARAFAWHPEQGRLDRAGLAAAMAQDWFDADGFFLAVDGSDRLLGFHWTKVHPSDPTPPPDGATCPIGEVYVLGVDPDSPVRHLGGPLTEVGLGYLARRGLATVMLYVEADNERALALYHRLGFVHYQSDVVYSRRA